MKNKWIRVNNEGEVMRMNTNYSDVLDKIEHMEEIIDEQKYDIQKTVGGASKDMKDKYAIGGFPLDILEILNKPLTNGLRKGYTEHDWMNGVPNSVLMDAGLRHLQKYNRGETIDPDGDIPHLYAVAWNFAVMALNHYYGRDNLDDRWLEEKLDGYK